MSERPNEGRRGVLGRLQTMMRTPEGLAGRTIGVLKYVVLLGALFYGLLFYQFRAWQLLTVAIVLAVNAALLFLAQYWTNTGRSERAEWLLLGSAVAGFGSIELLITGQTVFAVGGGLLFMVLYVLVTRPRRPAYWGLGALALVGVALLAQQGLLIRYLFVQTSLFQLNTLVSVGIVGVLGFLAFQLLEVFQRGNLTTRLFLGFLTATLIPLLLLGVIGSLVSLNQTNEAATTQLALVNGIAQRNLHDWIDEVQEELLGTLPPDQVNELFNFVYQPGTLPNPDGTYTQLTEQLREHVAASSNVNNIHLIDAIGRVHVSTQRDLEGTIVDGELYFINGQFAYYVQMPEYSAVEDRVLIFAAMPLAQTVAAPTSLNNLVIAAELNEDVLFALFNDINAASPSDTLEIYMVNLNFELVTPVEHTAFDPGLSFIETSATDLVVNRRSTGEGRYPSYYDGEPVFGSFAFIPELRVGVITEQSQAEVYGPLLQTVLIAVLVTVFSGLAALVLGWTTTRNVTAPIESLNVTAEQLAAGDMSQRVAIVREDELGELADSLNEMTARTREVLENLEGTVADRTAELERRAQYLQAAAEVGQAAAEFYNLDELLSPVTHLISERFGFYHVGIFLIDPNREFAVLRAANSEGGYRMLQRGHRLRVGQEGMVGYVTSTGSSRVLQSVAGDVIHFDNPDLPLTRSEMTLPLEASGELLGALDVQSTEENPFSEEDVQVLQVLANQVALAINNARLFEQLQASLEAERRVFGELSRDAWIDLLRGRSKLGVRIDQGGLSTSDTPLQAESSQALRDGKPVQSALGPEKGYSLAVPIKVHGDVVLGVLETSKPFISGPWTLPEITILEQIGEQLGIALENARLFDQTQRQAFRERVAADVSGKVWSSSDIETILQTTVQELSQALNASQGRIRLRFPEENGN